METAPFDSEPLRKTLAQSEHVSYDNSICMTSEEMSVRFGDGIEAYFFHCKVLIAINFVISILQLGFFSRFADAESPSYTSGQYWYEDFFVSRMSANKYAKLWIGINIACVIISGLTLPVLLLKKKSKEEEVQVTLRAVRTTDAAKDVIIRYTAEGKIDVSHHFRTSGNRFIRYCFSTFIFCGLIVVQILVSYYATKADEDGNAGISFLIAVVVSILNLIYGFVADMLTELEKPSHMRTYKVSNTFKLLLFKLANVITVYAAKNFANQKDCAYTIIAQQFLYILLVDIVLMNIVEIALPSWTAKLRRRMADQDKDDLQSDQDLLPYFDVSSEYLEIMYRQYIVYMAMTVFPLSTVLGLVGNMVEYWLDKVKLCKLTGKPKRMDYSFKAQGLAILIFQFISFIAAIFTPYAGVYFILSGQTADDTTVKCKFP